MQGSRAHGRPGQKLPVDSARKTIREVGMRATPSRIAVLQLLTSVARPFTHAEVSEALSKDNWDRATLYRNLVDLADKGIIRRVHVGSAVHFEASFDDKHAHFVCTDCGTVECTPAVAVRATRSAKTPSAINKGNVEVQLQGVCDVCA